MASERDELQAIRGNESLEQIAEALRLGSATPSSEPKGDDSHAIRGETKRRMLALEKKPRLKKEPVLTPEDKLRLKIVAHIILRHSAGHPAKEIQQELNQNGIMYSYKLVDEMISRWEPVEGLVEAGGLQAKLMQIGERRVSVFRDRTNDITCKLLSGQSPTRLLDHLLRTSQVWRSGDLSRRHEVLCYTQYGEWILVTEPAQLEGLKRENVTEARELSPAQAVRWFCDNQISLPETGVTDD
jgi:hypothetical protein